MFVKLGRVPHIKPWVPSHQDIFVISVDLLLKHKREERFDIQNKILRIHPSRVHVDVPNFFLALSELCVLAVLAFAVLCLFSLLLVVKEPEVKMVFQRRRVVLLVSVKHNLKHAELFIVLYEVQRDGIDDLLDFKLQVFVVLGIEGERDLDILFFLFMTRSMRSMNPKFSYLSTLYELSRIGGGVDDLAAFFSLLAGDLTFHCFLCTLPAFTSSFLTTQKSC